MFILFGLKFLVVRKLLELLYLFEKFHASEKLSSGKTTIKPKTIN
jgi:hypothetical protein